MRNLSIKLYRTYSCYTNITLYDVIYSVRYYPRFSVTTVGLGTYHPRIWRSTCISFTAVKITPRVLHDLSYTNTDAIWSQQ